MDYEEYFASMEYEENYENGFCPFSRKKCMGSDCQLSDFSDDIFHGCKLAQRSRCHEEMQ